MYHIGSLAAFRKASDSVIINRCLGASGGALVACAAVADLDSLWLEAVPLRTRYDALAAAVGACLEVNCRTCPVLLTVRLELVVPRIHIPRVTVDH